MLSYVRILVRIKYSLFVLLNKNTTNYLCRFVIGDCVFCMPYVWTQRNMNKKKKNRIFCVFHFVFIENQNDIQINMSSMTKVKGWSQWWSLKQFFTYPHSLWILKFNLLARITYSTMLNTFLYGPYIKIKLFVNICLKCGTKYFYVLSSR